MRLTWISPLLLLAASGCGSEEEPLTTDGIGSDDLSLVLSARSNGSTMQAVVNVEDMNGASLTLGASDQLLLAESGGAELPMVGTGSSTSSYAGQIATSALDFTLSLAREGGERKGGSFTLPPGFSLTVPVVDAPRSQPIPIVWDNVDPNVSTTIVFSGCLNLTRGLDPDTGMFEIQPADIAVSDPSLACTIDVQVTRSWKTMGHSPGLTTLKTNPVLMQIREASISTVP